MNRLYVEKKPAFRSEADALLYDVKDSLRLQNLESIRILQRYDIEGASEASIQKAIPTVFAEPPVDDVYLENFPSSSDEITFGVEYLPGQFDQRSDSAAQCLQILGGGERPTVAAARIYLAKGKLTAEEITKLKKYLINPVDSREADLAKPNSIRRKAPEPSAVPAIKNFLVKSVQELTALRKDLGLAMSDAYLLFC
jgi:phosphoribosylformylglycinamidine synthase